MCVASSKACVNAFLTYRMCAGSGFVCWDAVRDAGNMCACARVDYVREIWPVL